MNKTVSIIFMCLIGVPAWAQESDCPLKIRAGELVNEDDTFYKSESFKKLSSGTQLFVQTIDGARKLIALQRSLCVSMLKRSPKISDSQLKWVVEIDDLYVEAERGFSIARMTMIVAEGQRDGSVEQALNRQALAHLSKAANMQRKADRDLETLFLRIEAVGK